MATIVWIDTDAGFDDMVAIAMVAHAAAFELLGCSVVAGNAPLPVAAHNLRRMAAHFGWRFPLYSGRDRPLLGNLVTAEYVLGADALGGQGGKLPAPHDESPIADNGVAAMADAIATAPAPVTILALGPLGNVAAMLLAFPDTARRVERIVWMGGSATSGNHTAAAEFNAFADPEAAQVVVASGVPFAMVGLDCCRQVTVTLDDVAGLRKSGATVTADLFEAYVRIAANGARPMALYDPVAAAALVDPALVSFAAAHIVVECGHGPARGMTVVETRANKASPNALVATKANAQSIRELALATLRAP